MIVRATMLVRRVARPESHESSLMLLSNHWPTSCLTPISCGRIEIIGETSAEGDYRPTTPSGPNMLAVTAKTGTIEQRRICPE